MKLSHLAGLGSIAVAALAVPAVAQPPHTVKTTRTTVTTVHGPLKILPHHKNKICRTHYYNHRRVTKCYYH